MSVFILLKVIRAARKLDITLCRVGRIPGSNVVHQMYSWVSPVGRSVSPPLELDRLGQTDSVGRKSGFSLLKDSDERKVRSLISYYHNFQKCMDRSGYQNCVDLDENAY